MMNPVNVLYFAADPFSIPPEGRDRLLLDREYRETLEKVRLAEHRDVLRFHPRMAARVSDIPQALRETRPQVVHFSGHGGVNGLAFTHADDHGAQRVDAAALEQVFRAFRGNIQLAVLSACDSHEEARAIARAVGCAIGISGKISDEAAIVFNAYFYSGIAFGESVRTAFDRAKAVIALHKLDFECLELIADGADASHLVLIPSDPLPATLTPVAPAPAAAPAEAAAVLAPPRRGRRLVPGRVGAAASALVVTAAMVANPPVGPPPIELTPSDIACGAQLPGPGRPLTGVGRLASSPALANAAGSAAVLAEARALFGAGNYRAAAQAFEEAATAGNAEAMGCLGYMYLYGRGVEQKLVAGFNLVHDAAFEERDPHAMYALGHAYLNGIGTDAREHLAKHWFQEAAEQRFAEAIRSLGTLVQKTRSDSSHRAAVEWFKKAVDAQSVDARVDIGLAYERGLGVRRDTANALRWYRSAADDGSPRGMLAVGQSFERGFGVPQSYDSAISWYRRAAHGGSADAMHHLGVLYAEGRGVRRSRTSAIRWFKRAERAGDRLADDNLRALRGG
jgi:TPR repeat protein